MEMHERWLVDVTDLKQYICCPRIVYYRYCLPTIRPLTYTMEMGIEGHKQEEEREVRRSLKAYGIQEGERLLHYPVYAEALGLKGKIDLVIITPSMSAPEREAVIVEYKHSEQKAGPHFRLQLAAYALMLEEVLNIPARRAFLYSIPLRKAEAIPITAILRKRVREVAQEIRQIMISEQMPEPTRAQRRCTTCEFRRFCNDVV
jgi:CRISPR-associated exonuclease Cas4